MFARCRQPEAMVSEAPSSLPVDFLAMVHDGRFHRPTDLDSGSRVLNRAHVAHEARFEPKPKRTEVP